MVLARQLPAKGDSYYHPARWVSLAFFDSDCRTICYVQAVSHLAIH